VPEPYPTYLMEAVARLLVDEADLWPRTGFLTANLLVSTVYMDAHPTWSTASSRRTWQR
jgi:NitT/TauT family transport system substrate-binding protein